MTESFDETPPVDGAAPTSDTPDPPPQPAPLSPREKAARQIVLIRKGLQQLFVGQNELVKGVLTAVIANGHVMIESYPGLGKTLLARVLGRLLGVSQRRIQFTPDLMPSDITGSHVFDMSEKKFTFHPGPVFASFLLADEINRSPAKTHAALLEVMAEGQVTIDGKRYQVPKPFLVMATQNPVENEGTYPLPEAQLDRFFFKLHMDYPKQAEEEQVLKLHQGGNNPMESVDSLQPITNAEGLQALQKLAAETTVDDSIISYITQIVRKTREYPGIEVGASPRAGLTILAASRVVALMDKGRDFVMPEDVLDVAIPALRHRVILSPEAEIEGTKVDTVLKTLCREIPVPRGQKTPASDDVVFE